MFYMKGNGYHEYKKNTTFFYIMAIAHKKISGD